MDVRGSGFKKIRYANFFLAFAVLVQIEILVECFIKNRYRNRVSRGLCLLPEP